MSIAVSLYAEPLREEWDRFVRGANNGTIFHLQKFLDYHTRKFNWNHLLFYRGNELVAVFPCGLDGNTLRSPTGASYGGLVLEPYCSIEIVNAIVQALTTYCEQESIKEIVLTPPMQVYSRMPDEVQEYALLQNGFEQIKTQYSSVINLEVVSLDKGRRSDIRRAKRDGLVVKENKDFEGFFPILVKNKEKYDARPVHTIDEMKKIDALFGAKLFLAVIDGRTIGGLWILPASKTCAQIFYSASLHEYRRHNAIVSLVAHAIDWARKGEYRYLDYGVSTDTTTEEDILWSLARFKERLGGSGCLRRTYYRKLS
ncbi:MAG: GNAT family N-acetyltransferase [Candidatus Neomarinimicrobiota bacterium]